MRACLSVSAPLGANRVERGAGLPQEMIDEADRDGDGEINTEEFLRIMKKTNLC